MAFKSPYRVLPWWRRRYESALGAMPGINPFDFSLSDLTFAAGMMKRTAPGPFAAAPIVQGLFDGSGVPDVLSFARGSQIRDNFYANFDAYQFTAVKWWTPEKARDAGQTDDEYLWYVNSNYWCRYEHDNARLVASVGGQTHTDSLTTVAATTYCVCVSGDTKNTVDGTNYIRISVNNAHDYGTSTQPTASAPDATCYLGSDGDEFPASAILEGATLYRRVLTDSNGYGVDVGNAIGSDELTEIYNAGAGQDPCLVTGSFDVVFCLPTNSTAGALTTGTGNAWSHPHSSAEHNDPWFAEGQGPDQQWAVEFNGSSTVIDCGSGATLDDIPSGAQMTVEAWIKPVATNPGIAYTIVSKGDATIAATGWVFYVASTGIPRLYVNWATTDRSADGPVNVCDGKWHHVVGYVDDTAKTVRVAVDGVWGSVSAAGAGAYVSDAALNLRIGRNSASAIHFFDGDIGWVRLSDNDRHTAGTDFDPPRDFPGADGNTVEAWNLNDGTGATAVAQVTSPGNDGTISNGTWVQKWLDVGTPPMPYSLEFDGAATILNGTSGANIDNLPSGASGFTAEGWFRHDTAGESSGGMFWTKTGWYMQMASATTVRVFIDYDTTDINETFSWTPDGELHHWLLTYNENGADRFARVYRDGILVHTTAASVGNYAGDAASTFYIGNNGAAGATMDGAAGWQELSDNVRETGSFVPSGRETPRANDANMHLRYAMTEGAGTSVADTSGNAYNGTITMGSGTWRNSVDSHRMDVMAGGSRLFQWGVAVGSDGANDGIEQHKASLAAGSNYVARIPVGYEADKRGYPSIVAYDETNGAAISTFNGPRLTGQHTGANNSATLIDSGTRWPQSLIGATVWNITDQSSATITAISGDQTTITAALAGGTDNDWDTNDVYFIIPVDGWVWCEPFCFELPTNARGAAADCTEISLRLLNAAGEGVLYWHQAEVQANVLDDPSVEHNNGTNPLIISGWTNSGLDAGDTEFDAVTVHSGAGSLEWNTGSSNEGQYFSNVVGSLGLFFSMGAWIYGDGGIGFRVGDLSSRMSVQAALATDRFDSTVAAVWRFNPGVLRVTNVNTRPGLLAAIAATGDRFSDDHYAFQLDDVSLTVTPASEANSAESGGVRLDGLDQGPQTQFNGVTLDNHIEDTQGWIRWTYRPRHSPANAVAFGVAAAYVMMAYRDATHYIRVTWTAANTLTLEFNDGGGVHNNTWNPGAAIVVDTNHLMEIVYSATDMILRVDGTDRITINQPVDFGGTRPNTIYWHTHNSYSLPDDAVFAAP